LQAQRRIKEQKIIRTMNSAAFRAEAAWLAFFLLLTLAFTWPLGDLRQAQLPAHDDALFSVWRLAWVAHQLPIAPFELFNANIFWPLTNTLAFSDAMLFLGFAGAPLIWLGVHPVAVHNILLIAAFVLAGYAAMRLVRFFTPSVPAQVIAGLVFAYAPYRIAHVGHLELLWTAFLPWALLCLYSVLRRPTVARSIAFGVAVALQGLCSVYYMVFLVIWLVPAALLARAHLQFRWSRHHVVAGTVAIVTALILLGPYLLAYSRAREAVGPRAAAEVRQYSALPQDYLRVPPGNLLYDTSRGDAADERSLFVGTIALALALFSIARSRTRTALVFAVLTIVALDLSFGVNGVTYPTLVRALPPLDSFRAPARFGVLVLLGVSVLAGLGTSALLAAATPVLRRLAATVLVAGLSLEYWSAPLNTQKPALVAPAAYAWLAAEPRTVILEFPVPTPNALWRDETTYQYFSIYHWQPMANGYSGHAPAAYLRLLNAMREFPSQSSVTYLRDRGVHVVLLHEKHLDHGIFDALLVGCANRAWFSQVRVFEDPALGRIAACRLAVSVTDAGPQS
jgi:hypothetical protein